MTRRGKLVEVFPADCRTIASLLGLFTEAPRKRPWGKKALSVVEVKQACCKPPAIGDVRISKGERRGFSASVDQSISTAFSEN